MGRRRAVRSEEETRVPIIIPVRRDMEERQITQLRHGLERVASEIQELQRYAESITVPPTGQTASGIEADAQRLERTISRMRLSSIPVLGERFSDEISAIQDDIRRARSEVAAGRLGSGVRDIERARTRLVNIGRVFEIELGILMAGEPQGLGVPEIESVDDVLDAVEGAFLDMGTETGARSEMLLQTAQHYSTNASYYNIDNATVRRERDALIGFMVERGRDARARRGYSSEQQASDRQLLSRFRSNLESMKSQVQSENTRIFTEWRNEINQLLRQENLSETNRRQYTELRREIDRVLRRMRSDQEVRSDELMSLTRRYLLATGREMPRSYSERRSDLEQTARELRGSARTVSPNTQQWFAEHAIQLLSQNELQLANIAVSMALLERSARSARAGARSYMSPERYASIAQIIEQRRMLAPSDRSSIAHEIQVASLAADIASLSQEYSRMRVAGPSQPRRQRVMLAAEAARTRLRAGDVEGARRLLQMATAYSDLLVEKRWRDFAGRNEMEQAIDAEITGQDSQQEFDTAFGIYQLSQEAGRFRSAISDWSGRGIAGQKRVVEQGLESVERLAREGHAQQAREVLTMLMMYADAVERLGVRRRGRISSISEEDAGRVRGMERALNAAAAMRERVDTVVTQDFFMQSYNASMQAYVQRESESLGALASSRRSGQATVTRAIEAARARAGSNDFRGAITLLEYVRDFYGRAGGGKTEGWRYRLYTGTETRGYGGYRFGRRRMLEGIQMEIDAQSEAAHLAAAQRIDSGSGLMSQTAALLNDSSALLDRFYGRTPFAEGQSDTRGRIGLGERSRGRYREYLDLEEVRGYEAANPNDPVTGSGPSLTVLANRLAEAARNGNLPAYTSVRRQFEERLQLVASRTQRARIVSQAGDQLAQLESLTGGSSPEFSRLYANAEGQLESGTAGARRRIAALERRRAALYRRITGMANTAAEFPTEEYTRLLTDIAREGRTARAYALVTGQLQMNETYRRMVAGNGGGFVRSRALEEIADERRLLQQCQSSLLLGTREALAMAETRYRDAMGQRADACGWYRGENALTFRDSESWTRGITEGAEFLYDMTVGGMTFDQAARRVGDETSPNMRDEFAFLQNMHSDAFHSILFGSDTREEAQQAQRLLNAARMVEISHLGIPANNAAQVLNDFIPDQRTIREQAAQAVTEFRAGRQSEGERLLTTMETRYNDMATRAEDAQWYGNAALIGTGIVVSFIPGGGWVVGGGIFTSMAFDQVMTEIAVDGEASAGSWAILGLTIATMGLSGAAAITRGLAVTEVGANVTVHSARLLTVSRALSYAALGVGLGFSGYLGYESYEAFSRGDTRNGILMAGMALLPLAHLAGARVLRTARGAPNRAAVRAQLEAALEDVVPARSQPDVQIEVNEAPSVSTMREQIGGPARLFRFLQRYVAADAQARAAMVSEFPEAVRTRIASLADHTAIRASIESGEVSRFALEALRSGIRDFNLPPEGGPGGGPRGTRPQTDAAGLLRVDEIRSFLRNLLIPDGAPETALSLRDAARAKLAQLRSDPEIMRQLRTRGETPDGRPRDIFDDFVDSPDYAHARRALNFGRMIPRAQQTIENIQAMIRSALPEAPLQAEAVAQRQILQQAVGYDGPLVMEQGTAAEGPTAMARQPGARASAGGGRGPSTVTPGRVTGEGPPAESGGGRAGGGGRARGPATPEVVSSPEEAAAAAAQRGEAQVALVRRGLVERGIRGIIDRVSNWRAEARARRAPAEAPSNETILDSASRRMTDAMELIRPPEEVRAAMEQASARAQTLEAEVARLREAGASEANIRTAQQAAEAARAEATTAENTLSNMPSRMVRIFTDLYNMARSTRGTASEAYRRLMVKMYADPNLRPYLEQAAGQNTPEGQLLNRALSLTRNAAERAAGTRRGLDTYLGGETRRPFTREEMGLVFRAIETASAQRIARVEAAIEQSAARLDQAERAAADANSALESARSRGVRAGRIQRLERAAEAANTAHEEAFEAHQQLLTSSRGTQSQFRPLAQTEALLGYELTPAERATMVLNLESQGALPPEAVSGQAKQLLDSVLQEIRRVQPGEDPVAEALRTGVIERAARGGNLDEILTDVLRSDRVLDAVRENWPPARARIFEQAAQAGNIDTIIDGGSPAGRLLQGLRTPQISRNMQALGIYQPRISQLQSGFAEQAAILSAEGDVRVRDVVRRAAGSAGRWLLEHEPFSHWGALQYSRAVRAAMPGSRAYAALRNAPRMLPQLAAWGAMLYGAYHWGYGPLYDALSDADDIQAGIAVVQRDFGVELSEDNAAWIIQNPSGREYYYHMPNTLPQGSQRRPRNAQEFQQVLERSGFFVDPYRLDQWLSDGRTMAARLDDINELLNTRRTTSGADQIEAERALLEIVSPWGMTLENINQLLARPERTASRTQLTVTDLADLRVPDWQRRGIVTTFASGVATQLLVDAGVIGVGELRSGRIGRGHAAMVQFLTANPDVFAFIWQAMQQGHIPVAYIDNVIESLSGEGRLSAYRTLVSGRRTLDQVLREQLANEHLYLSTAIRQNSFLGALDRRAAADPQFRSTFEGILSTYRDNAAALRAFNQFNLTEGDFGEEIYGDAQALAQLIAENPSTALATARERGYVASRIFGQMDSSLRSGQYGSIISFAVSHSSMSGGRPDAGVMKWMADNSHQIANLREILANLAGNPQAENMSMQEIYDYLDRQSGYYRSRGWWRGDTPIETRERAAGRRAGRAAPMSEQVPRRTGRGAVLEHETRPAYPRRPGFETDAGTPEQQEEGFEAAEPAPVLNLSPEATAFYGSEERGGLQLSRIVDARIDRMFADTESQDGPLMAQVYGTDRDRARQEIKVEIYRILTSESERDAGLRRTMGLSVRFSGAGMEVQVDAVQARRGLRNRIYSFVRTRRASAQQRPPAQEEER